MYVYHVLQPVPLDAMVVALQRRPLEHLKSIVLHVLMVTIRNRHQ